LAYRFGILKFLAKFEKYFPNSLISGFDIFDKLVNLSRLCAYMRAGHRPSIVVSSCLAGLFVRLTGRFVLLAGLFVSLAGFWVFGNKICQTVRDEIFFSLHIILGVGEQRDLGNKIYQTIGDTLRKQYC
jgi:hypothetical protein